MRKQYWLGTFLGITLACLPLIAFGAKLTNPLGEGPDAADFRVIIGRVIQFLLGLSGSLALLMFVWGGVQWMISGGVPDKIKKGKDTLIWATIGLVVIFTAYTLVSTLIKALANSPA
ncbi:pilin [Patescibacteria group bacterium]|nr:pilin [Patescibacteria group bacterium]MBU1705507.1 pilin [Patescibacteria group bacterium]